MAIETRGATAPPPMEFYKLSELQSDNETVNPYLKPGDIVIVNEVPPVYVTGRVVAPQAITLRGQMTLTQAIAMAGGVTADAMKSKVVIYRQRNELIGQLAIPVDLVAVKKHRAEDPILQPYDIVDVGGSGQQVPANTYPIFDSRPLIPRAYRVIY